MTANRLLAYGAGRESGRFSRDRVWQRSRDTSRFATDVPLACKPGERERLDLRIVAREDTVLSVVRVSLVRPAPRVRSLGRSPGTVASRRPFNRIAFAINQRPIPRPRRRSSVNLFLGVRGTS